MKKYLIAAALATMVAPAVPAATIAYETETSVNLFNSNETLSLPKFDTSSGTLTGVDFILEAGVSGSILSSNVVGDDPIGSILSTTTATGVNGTPVSVQAVSQPGIETGVITSRVSWARGTPIVTSSFGPDSFFIGNGTFDFEVSSGTLSSDTAFNFQDITDKEADAGAAVVYTFDEIETPTPIPLPAAAWMLLAALGSLFAFRRFKSV